MKIKYLNPEPETKEELKIANKIALLERKLESMCLARSKKESKKCKHEWCAPGIDGDCCCWKCGAVKE